MSDTVEIRVRVRDDTAVGFRGVDGKLRDLRGRFVAEGNAAGSGFSAGLASGLSSAGSSLGSAASGLGMVGAAAAAMAAASFGGGDALANLAHGALLIPGAFSVAAAAISTFQVAVSGVGAALGAMGTSASGGGGGGGGAQSAARAIRDATESINKTRQRQQQVAEDTGRAISRAERDVSQAAEESARDISRAKKDQARTEQSVADQIQSALEQQQAATEDLTQARRDAAQTIDDLRDRVQHYANDEEDARIAVLSAYAAQRKVNADITSTNLEKLKASQSVKDAEERLADTQKSRAEDTAKLADEEAKGVEGSDQVVAAKKRLQDATDNVAAARKDGAQQEADAAARVADAEQAGAERVATAKENLADTERTAARQRADAAQSVTDAEQRLKDAQEDAAKSAGAAAAGANAYADALAKLSPNARAFVEKIRELKPAWEEMQKAVQNSFFEGFADKTQKLSDTYLPKMKDGMVGIADSMNKMALYAADALMKPEVVAAVNSVLENTKELFDNARPALGDFIEGFLTLAGIGSDYLPDIGKWLADIARDFKDWVNANPDKIRGFMSDAIQAFHDLWDIGTNVAKIFADFFMGGGTQNGKDFLGMVKDVTGFLAAHSEVVKGVVYAIAGIWVAGKIAGIVGSIATVVTKLIALGVTADATALKVATALSPATGAAASGAGKTGLIGSAIAGAGGLAGAGTAAVGGALLAAQTAMIPRMFKMGMDTAISVKLNLDPKNAQLQLASVLADIGNSSASVTLNGQSMPAQDALGQVLAAINRGEATVTLNGQSMPAAAALDQLVQSINSSGGTVTVNGQTIPAGDALRQILGQISGSRGNVTVGADTRPAINSIGDALRYASQTVTMTVRAVTGYISGIFGHAAGGVVGAGLQMVGEHGPELVKMAPGSQVSTAGATRRMRDSEAAPTGSSSGGGTTITFAGDLDTMFATTFMRMIRTGQIQIEPAA